MHVTLRQLQVFEAVARHLNYTRAAEELHLSQPAVSMQIRELEENVELPLFEQLGKKIYLTEAGKELYHYSREISRQLKEVKEVLAQIKGVEHGHLNIAVASTANYFATRLLAIFVTEHPGISFSLDVTNRENLLEQLKHNEIDMVVMGQPPDDLDLASEVFMENPLVVIAPPRHALAGARGITLARLQQESFLVRERGSGTRIAMEKFFNKRGVSLKPRMEMTSNEAIKQAVEAGLGLGIVSVHTLELELEAKRLVILDIEDFPILRNWFVVHRRGKRLAPPAEAFRQFMLTKASDVLKSRSSEQYKESNPTIRRLT
jgi:LysR family transcriptional regulator, low CO2-responsive transcriptional regulator